MNEICKIVCQIVKQNINSNKKEGRKPCGGFYFSFLEFSYYCILNEVRIIEKSIIFQSEIVTFINISKVF